MVALSLDKTTLALNLGLIDPRTAPSILELLNLQLLNFSSNEEL